MISQLAVLSLVSAAVQFDFKVSNSHDLKLSGKAHKAEGHHKSSHKGAANLTVSNSTNSTNSTVEPVVNASLSSSYNFYFGEVLVGQPPQKFEVLLDTGSPVSWLYGPNGSYKNATQYYPDRSATHKKSNVSFSAEYGSGEYLGYWASDLIAAPQFVASNVTRNVSINATNSTSNATYNYTVPVGNGTDFNVTAINATLHNNATFNRSNLSVLPYSVPFEFGVVTSFASAAGAPGLLGLGPHIEGAGPKGYLSLPEAYKKYNVTSSSAFSVFLEKDVGRFLFGGADLKYVQLPFYRYSPRKVSNKTVPTTWTVTLDSLAVGSRNISVNSTASLDSGSPVSLLPHSFVDAVGRALNFTKNDKYQAYYTNSSRIPKGTISFHLNGGLEVTADISSFLVPGRYIWLDDGPKNVTALGFLGASQYLLGDAFFRNTYTVLDPANGDVLVAKRSKTTINSTNSTNASTVVPINKLLNNKTAVVDVAANLTAPANKTTSIDGAANSKTLPFAANGYVGTVPASLAESLTAQVAAASGSASSSASGSSSSTSTKSKKKKNAGITNSPSTLLSIAAAAFYLV